MRKKVSHHSREKADALSGKKKLPSMAGVRHPDPVPPVVHAAYQEISVHALQAGLHQPRTVFEPESLQRLATTIQKMGVLEPLVVRPSTTHPQQYEIIAGERRWRAAKLAQLPTVPCLIKNYSEAEARQIAIIENTARENLNPIDQANALAKLLNSAAYSHDEIAATLGHTRSYVSHLLRLLKLDKRVQQLLKQGVLSEAHGRLLASVPGNRQYPLAERCWQGEWSKRQLEAEIKKQVNPGKSPLDTQPQNREDRYLKRLEQKLSDHLGYTAKVELDAKKKGYLQIAFADLDQLQGILEKLGYQEE